MASQVVIDIIGNDKATNATNSVTAAFGKLATTLTAIAAAGAAAFLVLGKQALEATAEYERLTLTMETLVARELKAADATLSMADALGQASPKAQELLSWIQKLAIESPFDQQGVADAFRMALAYGFTSDEAQRLTQNLIDFTAGTGQSVAVMNNAAYALGQIRAKGKLAGQEILQLVNAGIPVNEVLKEMGYTLDDVSNGLVSADEFLEALNKNMEEDFSGAAKRATNSWAGLLSSLGDIKKIGLRTLFADTFEVLQPLVAEFATWLQGDGLKVLEGWSKELGSMTQSLADMFGALSSGDFDFVQLTQAFEDWADSIDWNKISNELADGIDSINWAELGARAQEGAKNIVDGIAIMFEETDWEAIFSSLGVAFMDFMAGLTGQGDWDNVMATWKNNFEQLKKHSIMQSTLIGASIPISIATHINAGLGGVVNVMWSMYGQISNVLETIKKLFFTKFQEAMQQARNALEGMKVSLLTKVMEVISLIRGAIKPITISVVASLPNFELLAAQIAAGVALMAGAGGGKKGAQVGGGNALGGRGGAGMRPRAVGGNVSAGRAYTVGEQGREMFIPDENGQIVSNKNLGNGRSGMVVNLTYAPAFSTASKDELLTNIKPMLDDWYRLRLQS